MAWKNFNKTLSRRPPDKSWTEEELKIIGFVMSKNIKIAISPDWKHESYDWQIDIKIANNKWHTDPKRYNDSNVYDKLMEYYEYYYNKYNVNTNKNG